MTNYDCKKSYELKYPTRVFLIPKLALLMAQAQATVWQHQRLQAWTYGIHMDEWNEMMAIAAWRMSSFVGERRLVLPCRALRAALDGDWLCTVRSRIPDSTKAPQTAQDSCSVANEKHSSFQCRSCLSINRLTLDASSKRRSNSDDHDRALSPSRYHTSPLVSKVLSGRRFGSRAPAWQHQDVSECVSRLLKPQNHPAQESSIMLLLYTSS